MNLCKSITESTWEKKIKSGPGYVCKDRTDLYRPANETEIALGRCQTTINHDWDPDSMLFHSVDWYYCEKSKTCIHSYAR